mmetsp:Transcript_8551/g.7575  ORF Transcript_8551/g.7575 Transcript_8551/m.7575 type:complete len:188 (+) Transcript_8551:601-1164(+)
MIINHPYPLPRFNYWKNLNEEYKTDYEVIKKLSKLTKYQIPDYIKENNLSELDMYIFSMNPTKRQFEFIKNIALKKELKFKQNYEEGIKLLLKAKEIFEKNSCDLYAFIGFFLKSKIISLDKLAGSKVKESFMKEEDAFRNIWNIKVTPKIYEIDLTKDLVYGKIAKRYLKKADQTLTLEYNNFSID